MHFRENMECWFCGLGPQENSQYHINMALVWI